MILLPAELRARLPSIYSQARVRDPTVHLKFFIPDSTRAWFILEGGRRNHDFLFFGYVFDREEESWGYFTLSELLGARGSTGLAVERDLNFKPRPLERSHRTIPSGARANVKQQEQTSLVCSFFMVAVEPRIDVEKGDQPVQTLWSTKCDTPPKFPLSFRGQLIGALFMEAIVAIATIKSLHAPLLAMAYVAMGLCVIVMLFYARRKNTREAYWAFGSNLFTLLIVLLCLDFLTQK
jgi:Protein of unknown function (DUF2958)